MQGWLRGVALLALAAGISAVGQAAGDAAKTCPKCKSADCIYAVGINLAGAEFAGHEIPGIEGRHYGWPKEDSLDYWQSKGIRLVRLPFKWERLQPELMKDFDPGYSAGLARSVKLMGERGMVVVLDVHNYAMYRKNPIGSEQVPLAAFGDLWRRLAVEFKGNPAIWGYGLMNEPSRKCDWKVAAQTAIDAIRKVDRDTRIVVANDYAGWATTRVVQREKDLAGWAERSMPIATPDVLNDPSDNLVFELHTYFDHDASGTYRKTYESEIARTDGPEVRVGPNTGVDRARPFVAWLIKHKAKGFVGEYSAPANPEVDPRWMETLENFLAYLDENCIPSAFWSGGSRWTPGHGWVIERSGWSRELPEAERQKDRPQLEILRKHTR
jgi:endoglucanase